MFASEGSCDGLPHTFSVSPTVLDDKYDVVLVVADKVDNLPEGLAPIQQALLYHQQIDAAFMKEVNFVNIDTLPSKRLVFSPTGPLNRDYDDVRRWKDAAHEGTKRALRAGCSAILLVRVPGGPFPCADEAALLGSFHALYTPLEIREDSTRPSRKATSLGFWSQDAKRGSLVLNYALGIEKGRLVGRDLGGTDPERMCPANFEQYVCQTFQNTSIKVKVERGKEWLEKEYPLFGVVNRGSEEVEKFRGCVINLEYVGEGDIEQTLMMVGKGVTYDTGGHDIKAGGIMAGMSRDKCGASVLAGFFKALDELKPRNVKVVGALCVVRNVIGLNAYVSDELITSRSGKRVRIGNTDAEGRLVLADVLCKMKERALSEVNPHLMTWATLTGHSRISYGNSYAAIMDNGPARREKFSYALMEAGEEIGDTLEVSVFRREDYEFHTGKSEYEDLLQCSRDSSTRTFRGHQGPGVFVLMAAGLDKHGIDSEHPLKYTHFDLPNHGPFPGIPTAAPLAAVFHKFFYQQMKCLS